MATMLTADRKRISLSIEEKARLLTVFDIGEPFHLAVTSGTRPHSAYVVHHNGVTAHYCPCQAIGRCAHKIAAQWHLEALAREQYNAEFAPNGL